MQTIWRVQNKEGIGPYRAEQYVDKMCYAHDRCLNHPPPLIDPKIGRSIANNEFCGFLTKKDAQKWFLGYFKILRQRGFTLQQVNGNITVVGEKQVLFTKDI